MAKRKKKVPEEPPGVPAWMATFSDLVTLLLTFFVMLMAMANFEESSKLHQALESIRTALGQMGFGDGLVSMVVGDNLSDQQRKADTVRPEEVRDRQALDADLSPTIVKISNVPSEIRLTLDDQAFFATGTSTLRPSSRSRIRNLGLALAGQTVGIRIEGHTDDEGDERANWELSSLRALSVVEVLQRDSGLPAERLTARGYGSFHPQSVRNADRARNRRIEVVLTGDDADTFAAMQVLRELEVDGG